jgi:hypothetical protein
LTSNTVRLDSLAASPPARIQDFAFLTGRWMGPGLGGETEELWSSPAAGTMAGTFRLIESGKVAFYEFFALEEHEGSVALRLKHFYPGPGLRGWEERDRDTSFRLVRVEDGKAWFHGLTYLREGPDTLVIYLALRGADQVLREEVFRLRRAGPDDGTLRGAALTYCSRFTIAFRASCAPSTAKSARITTSSTLVARLFRGTELAHFTRLFRYRSVAARKGTKRLPMIV